jgi:AmmeMemoRadiSam system protein B/AmmeMemoRadiSam system protein A
MGAAFLNPQSKPEADGVAAQQVRPPAVAGGFYPDEPNELGKKIDAYLAEANSPAIQKLRALVCPHAGYEYSGPIAGFSYKQLVGRDIDTVVILGPSHTSMFRGAYVSPAAAYQTPLGKAPVASLAKELAKDPLFAVDPDCKVQRPAWARQLPRTLPSYDQDRPDTWEHSVEVQVPFIQKVAPKASIVPIVCGELDPRKLADVLAKHLTDKTMLIASSDLSHYTPYKIAQQLDAACMRAILRLDTDWLTEHPDFACGRLPVAVLTCLARQKGWRAKVLDLRNSGDTTNDKTRGVVGYAAVAFYESNQPASAPADAESGEYSSQEKKYMLELARKVLTEAVTNKKLPDIDPNTIPALLAEKKGCFVTLTKGGQLRGCIGYILPHKPLIQALVENSANAALNDNRFRPVTGDELGQIEVEVSVLSVPRELKFTSWDDLVSKLRPHVDGVVLRLETRQATYLPQVWEQIPQKEEFIKNLVVKAGLPDLPKDAWEKGRIVIETYQAEAFKEDRK